MWDIEILFIAYNISRCHKEGRTIRDSINAKLQMIASFNGYKEDFNSFSDIVDWYNFVHSPLNNLVRSGCFIVTDADTPFPYSVTEFLELLSRTSFFTGLIVLNYPEEDTLRLPEIKYRILKKGTEFEFASPQPKPETNDPGVFFDRSVDLTASVCKKDLSEFIARLPTRFKEQTFGGTGLNSSFILHEEERHSYILDVCAGIDYLHSRGVLHLDLKPKNIIVVERRTKIADFGLSKQCILSRHDDSPKQREVITLWYRAPEMLDSNYKDDSDRYTFEVDIWSLACVILEIETGVAAFPGDGEEETLELISRVLGKPPVKYYPTLKGEEKEDRLACIRDEFVRDTLLGMLHWKPKKRLSTDDVFDRFASHF